MAANFDGGEAIAFGWGSVGTITFLVFSQIARGFVAPGKRVIGDRL